MMKRIITLTLAAILLAGAQTSDQAQRMFKAARNAEVVDGDLASAIKQYKKIVSKYGRTERALAANALVRMAECHSKLGDAEAVKIYQRVVSEYSDQAEAVAAARAKLEGVDRQPSTSGDRVVWSAESIELVGGSVSGDGRYVAYTDWFQAANLMLRDLSQGVDRKLTGNKDWNGGGGSGNATFSPDGTEVAFDWSDWETRTTDLRVVKITGSGVPEQRTLFSNKEISIAPHDWSSDGEWIAGKIRRGGRDGEESNEVGVLRVRDGFLRTLRATGWRGPKKILFSPDNKYVAYDLPANDEAVQRDVFVAAVDGSGDSPVVVHSAQDAVMGWSRDGKHLLFASDRTGSAALWALPISAGKATGAPTMLKPDIGSLTTLGVTDSGTLHIYKDTSTVGLHIAPIDLKAGKLTGPAVVESYRAHRPDWTPDGKYLAYKSSDLSGANLLSIRNVETGKLRSFPVPFNYFSEPRWAPDGRWLVAGARTFKGTSALYRFDAQDGAVSELAPGSHVARPSVSPDGKKIYYDYDPEKRNAYFELDLGTGQKREIFEKPANGGAGRLELSPNGRYIGTVTQDKEAASVLLIPVAGGEPRKLLTVTGSEVLAAWGGVTWTPDSQAIVAMKAIGEEEDWDARKKELWLIPIDGGEARKLDIDISKWLLSGGPGGIRMHPDGSKIAYFAGKRSQEVWALENALFQK